MDKSGTQEQKPHMGTPEKLLKLSETDMAAVKERVEQAVLEEKIRNEELGVRSEDAK